jgi:hypothetical protein
MPKSTATIAVSYTTPRDTIRLGRTSNPLAASDRLMMAVASPGIAFF